MSYKKIFKIFLFLFKFLYKYCKVPIEKKVKFLLILFFSLFFYLEKMIRDLFRRPRTSEIKQILISRRVFIIVSLILLFASFTLLCAKMIREKPTIASTFEEV